LFLWFLKLTTNIQGWFSVKFKNLLRRFNRDWFLTEYDPTVTRVKKKQVKPNVAKVEDAGHDN
jgi:hypothetical protein